jgi:hypothetical protein
MPLIIFSRPASMRLAIALVVEVAGGADVGLFLLGLRVLLLFVLDDGDTHLGKQRHGVLDLLGGDLVRRQHLVDLVVGDVAALLGLLKQLLGRSQ